MSIADTTSNQDLFRVDLTKVAALQQKRTLAFVNHFVITTVQFLNNFMKNCEQKLMIFERKLEKVEAAMVLLEARLSSIPEVSTIVPEVKEETSTSEAQPSETNNQEEPSPEPENAAPEENTEPPHPEYERFIKMVQVGVPLEAVKLKVSLEGLDPNIFAKLVSK